MSFFSSDLIIFVFIDRSLIQELLESDHVFLVRFPKLEIVNSRYSFEKFPVYFRRINMAAATKLPSSTMPQALLEKQHHHEQNTGRLTLSTSTKKNKKVPEARSRLDHDKTTPKRLVWKSKVTGVITFVTLAQNHIQRRLKDKYTKI